MKNKIILYSKLSAELRKVFRSWLENTQSDLISFPLKGKKKRGYIFNHDTCQYLVVMPVDYVVEDYDEFVFDQEISDFEGIQSEA